MYTNHWRSQDFQLGGGGWVSWVDIRKLYFWWHLNFCILQTTWCTLLVRVTSHKDTSQGGIKIRWRLLHKCEYSEKGEETGPREANNNILVQHVVISVANVFCTWTRPRLISWCRLFSPRKRGSMFSPALVCVSVCLSVTTITKKNVDGFVPHFMRTFLGGKGRPCSYFVTIGRGMWK